MTAPEAGPAGTVDPTGPALIADDVADWKEVADRLYFAIRAWNRGTWNASELLDRALHSYDAFALAARNDGLACDTSDP